MVPPGWRLRITEARPEVPAGIRAHPRRRFEWFRAIRKLPWLRPHDSRLDGLWLRLGRSGLWSILLRLLIIGLLLRHRLILRGSLLHRIRSLDQNLAIRTRAGDAGKLGRHC